MVRVSLRFSYSCMGNISYEIIASVIASKDDVELWTISSAFGYLLLHGI